MTATCSMCDRQQIARGLCPMHYDKMRKAGRLGEFSLTRRPPQPKPPCSIAGCNKPVEARGWCGMHYWRWKNHGSTDLPPVPTLPTVCTVEGCDKPVKTKSKGLCSMHQFRLARTGQLDLRPYDYNAAIERFWSRVERRGADECWPWCGVVLRSTGYGQFTIAGKRHSAHRLVYELAVGPIPDGLTIDHVKARGCSGGACVNPAHLEAVTMAENGRRSDSPAAQNGRKTECPKCGGEYIYDRKGKRYCRPCKLEWERNRREKRRASRV